jgi:hypothetical protein
MEFKPKPSNTIRHAIANNPEIGLDGAYLLQVIQDWCKYNEKRSDAYYFRNGFYWTSITHDQFVKYYPGLGSKATIRLIIKRLEDLNLLISYQFEKRYTNRTKFYRVNDNALMEFDCWNDPSFWEGLKLP